jgi:acetyl-CoA C-acetyltransferase
MKSFRPVAILGAKRIPFVRSFAQYSKVPLGELMSTTLKALVRDSKLQGEILGDVALGAVIQRTSDFALAREAVLDSGLDPHTPAYNVQRACGTSLEAAGQIALKIAAGRIESGIAGGADSNSDVPILLSREAGWKLVAFSKARSLAERLKILSTVRPSDFGVRVPGVQEPRTGLSMGEHCELMVKEWKISREEQDAFALLSHKNGSAAYEAGFMDEFLVEYKGLKRDTNLRADTSMEKLAKLKPAFDPSPAGTLTAGNSSPLSDGAAAVLLGSEEFAAKHSLPIWAYLTDVEAAAVDFVGGEGLLMAPTYAVARMLQRNKLKLQDFDFYEIHEAFAGQVLCTLKAWESDEYCRSKLGLGGAMGSIDRAKLNIHGSSVSLGHPFAATGARVLGTAAKTLREKKSGRGLISICTAGGMGVVAIVEASA